MTTYEDDVETTADLIKDAAYGSEDALSWALEAGNVRVALMEAESLHADVIGQLTRRRMMEGDEAHYDADWDARATSVKWKLKALIPRLKERVNEVKRDEVAARAEDRERKAEENRRLHGWRPGNPSREGAGSKAMKAEFYRRRIEKLEGMTPAELAEYEAQRQRTTEGFRRAAARRSEDLSDADEFSLIVGSVKIVKAVIHRRTAGEPYDWAGFRRLTAELAKRECPATGPLVALVEAVDEMFASEGGV